MPKKSLGQHWLTDRLTLEAIADCAAITSDDTVLEIGPGLGTLTSVLLGRARQVVAVEFDGALAKKLPGQFPGKNLSVHHEDILQFDFSRLKPGYLVVANVPYYITSKIVQRLSEADNPPSRTVLLVQKEVAERLAASPGEMSLLSTSAQIYHEVSLGAVVPSGLFTPPPKVDSRVVILERRSQPLIPPAESKRFFRLVKAGFSAKRKKLRSSLSGGLNISKEEAEVLLKQADIDPNVRAEALDVTDWRRLMELMA